MKNNIKVCTKGIWDTTIPGIKFDNEGTSNYAKIQETLIQDFPRGEKGEKDWKQLIKNIKQQGRHRKYDCIIGISGGTDSSYLLHIIKHIGLRPLALNLDNGWNSDIAVKNIKKMTSALGVDLETYVINYEEIKDLHRAYIKASLPWIDYPTDQAIHSILYKIALREKVKYILTGTDFRSEGKQPTEWTYSDSRQLKFIHHLFGKEKLKSYPIISFPQLIYYGYFRKIKIIHPFNYITYNKTTAKKYLQENYGWENYGGHHYENLFTKWAIGYWMYEKFNIDKRKITYSAQIISGEMSRDEALIEVNKTPYNKKNIENDTAFVLKKLDLNKDEFKKAWNDKNKSFLDYPSYYPLIKKLTKFIIPIVMKVFPIKPKIFYEMEIRKQ